MFDASRISEDAIEEVVARVRRRFAVKPKVAIAGFGKSGKSSLFNAIYGERVASVSMRTDETVEAQTRERFGIDFTDTPGIGTGKFSLERVVEMGVFDGQHVVIHTLNGASAISAEDERLHQAIRAASARRVTVVNKVDLLEDGERREFAESMLAKLGLGPGDFLFVSAKKGTGLAELVQRIAEVLPEAMQDAFIAQQQADVHLKEKRVRTLIYGKATVSAAVALMPFPVADIFLITPMQIAMVTAIGYFHGVEVTKERALELVATLGAGVGLREAARQLVKLIPGYGSVVSAGIAFAGTVALGEAANAWFKNKMKLDADELREVFRRAADRARAEYGERQARAAVLKTSIEALKARFDRGEITQEQLEQAIADLEGTAG
ncbi:MAG: GTPase [Polyangiaceae bacterium]